VCATGDMHHRQQFAVPAMRQRVLERQLGSGRRVQRVSPGDALYVGAHLYERVELPVHELRRRVLSVRRLAGHLSDVYGGAQLCVGGDLYERVGLAMYRLCRRVLPDFGGGPVAVCSVHRRGAVCATGDVHHRHQFAMPAMRQRVLERQLGSLGRV